MVSSSSTEYMVAVAELEDMTPRVEASKPILYVARFAKPSHGDLLRALKRRKQYRAHVLHVWAGFEPVQVDSLDEAKRVRQRLITELEKQHFVVNPTPDRPHSVYVFELDSAKYPSATGTVVYVGETSLTVEERLANHLAGKNSSAHVERAYVRRRDDLELNELYPSRVHATVAETALGKALQARGFVVAGPQGLENKPRAPKRES